MDFFDAVVRYETELWNHVERELAREHAVGLGQLEALRVVGRYPGACRVVELHRDLSITVGAVSKLVDRLEASGLVRRLPNPDDRRSSIIVRTDSGERALAAALAIAESALEDHLRGVGDDARTVTTVLDRLRQRLVAAEAVAS